MIYKGKQNLQSPGTLKIHIPGRKIKIKRIKSAINNIKKKLKK